MRYTCNKKAYPLFHKDCIKCPEYDPCVKGGKYCFIGAMENERIIPDSYEPLTQDIAAPLLVKHDYRNVKVAENTTVTIDIEEMKRKVNESISKRLRPQLFMNGA